MHNDLNFEGFGNCNYLLHQNEHMLRGCRRESPDLKETKLNTYLMCAL